MGYKSVVFGNCDWNQDRTRTRPLSQQRQTHCVCVCHRVDLLHSKPCVRLCPLSRKAPHKEPPLDNIQISLHVQFWRTLMAFVTDFDNGKPFSIAWLLPLQFPECACLHSPLCAAQVSFLFLYPSCHFRLFWSLGSTIFLVISKCSVKPVNSF